MHKKNANEVVEKLKIFAYKISRETSNYEGFMRIEQILNFIENFYSYSSPYFAKFRQSLIKAGFSESEAIVMNDFIKREKQIEYPKGWQSVIFAVMEHYAQTYAKSDEELMAELEALKQKTKDVMESAEDNNETLSAVKTAMQIIELQGKTKFHQSFYAPKVAIKANTTIDSAQLYSLKQSLALPNATTAPDTTINIEAEDNT
jgi:hypothetical protein